jgi:DNA (cytosine-5)-methyltransferase 1
VIFGSLFSGIEAASVAWGPLGWRCAWVAEIDPFASAVLARHYPDVRNLGDVNGIDADAVEPVDLVVFGSPCQSFSVAGKRLGLDDPRGNMALVGLRVVGRIRPRWVVWENVPGVLSSDGGRDFGAFLGLLGELGYGFAYRVLDAQHFGVPQRRRRVFVVGYLGDWRPAAAVLFESESLRGDSPPRREAGQGIAPTIAPGAHPGGVTGRDAENGSLIAKSLKASDGGVDREDGHTLIAFSAKDHGADHGDIAPTLRAGTHDKSHANAGVMPAIAFQERGRERGRSVDSQVDLAYSLTAPNGGGRRQEMNIAHSLRADGFDASEDGTGRGTPLVAFNITPSNSNKDYNARPSNRSQALTAGGNRPSARGGDLVAGMSVRRLTPRECERLQGLPDNYTLIPYRGKPAADGPRYRSIGNSMAVPCMSWIGHRIQLALPIRDRANTTHLNP